MVGAADPVRRSAAAVPRSGAALDMDAGTLGIESTRVVVDGKVIDSDGKTENAQHLLALDPFTLAVLKAHLARIDVERREFGPDYEEHGLLFCWEKRQAASSRYNHPGDFTSWPSPLACPRSTFTTCGTATRRRAGMPGSIGRR